MILENVHYFIAIVFLLILSIFDVKTFNTEKGFIPSVLTTSFLIVSFITSFYIIGYSVMLSGVLGSLLTLLFLDLDVFHGLADVKVFIASAMTLPNAIAVLIFALFMLILGTGFKYVLKKYDFSLVPYIPIIALGYIINIGVIYL